MNVIAIVGRLGSTPELKTTSSGKSVASFNVAVADPYDKDNATWFRVTAWGKSAEFAATYLEKGRLVSINGRMTCRKYEHEGQKRESWELVADNVQGLDRPREDAPGESRTGTGTQNTETGSGTKSGHTTSGSAGSPDDSLDYDPFRDSD